MKKFLKIFLGSVVMITSVFLSSCTSNKEVGAFYTLREAYSKGVLTNSDLTQIAEYYHDRYSANKQNNLSVNLLGEQTKKQIKQSYLVNILKDETLSDTYVTIYAYYGTYNGAIAVGITDNYNVYDVITIEEYEVGDVIFYNYAESDIRVWVE